LGRVRDHTRAPITLHKSGVYDSGGVSYMSRGVLRVGIRCGMTSISPLPATVLRLRDTSLDSFVDPAYDSLRDPM
jgi:hypothetical protein